MNFVNCSEDCIYQNDGRCEYNDQWVDGCGENKTCFYYTPKKQKEEEKNIYEIDLT